MKNTTQRHLKRKWAVLLNTTQQPFKRKWAGPIDNSEAFNSFKRVK